MKTQIQTPSVVSTSTPAAVSVPPCVIGLDLGDRAHHVCVLDAAGQIIREAALANTRPALAQLLVDFPRATVALAAGTHRPWISRYLTGLGATVLVANPRKLHAISRSERKCDPAMPRGSPVSPGWILSCSIPSSTVPPRPNTICWV